MFQFEVITIIFLFRVYVCHSGNIIKFLIIHFMSNIGMSWLVFISLNLKVSIKMIHKWVWRGLP